MGNPFLADYKFSVKAEDLWDFKGSFGIPLMGLTKEEIMKRLPNYIKTQKGFFPKWKQNFLKNNREFYQKNKESIDLVLPDIINLHVESWQKFEWNCLDLEKNIWNYIIQFRGSGIRIKRTDFFPSLVTVRTQMPIIGWKKRYISRRACSGSEALVLKDDRTPNLFTFKLWDWQRLGLDGKPRPINVERGKDVIDWKRDTEYVNKHLANRFTQVAEGDGWREECTGLHPNEFIETHRHWFSKPVTHHTNNSVNVLNLVEGEEAVIESPINAFKPFVVHYAETFIIPASVG